MASSSRTFARLVGAQLSATVQRPHLPLSTPLSATAFAAVRPIAKFTTTSCAQKPAIPLPSAILSKVQKQPISRQFQRSYADAAPQPPKKKPGKIRRTFRWARRLTYLSILGLVGAVAYDGYKDRYPDEQYTPDPNKKTLVILGR